MSLSTRALFPGPAGRRPAAPTASRTAGARSLDSAGARRRRRLRALARCARGALLTALYRECFHSHALALVALCARERRARGRVLRRQTPHFKRAAATSPEPASRRVARRHQTRCALQANLISHTSCSKWLSYSCERSRSETHSVRSGVSFEYLLSLCNLIVTRIAFRLSVETDAAGCVRD